MKGKILEARSIKELRGMGLSREEKDRIYQIQKVEYVVEDVQDRIDNYHTALNENYEGMEELLDAAVRKGAWEYVFDGIHCDGNLYEDEVELIISDIPSFPVCDDLAEWVEKNLDSLDLFYDYLVATSDGKAIVRIAEGSGDNLDKEDLDRGYIDYIDYFVYKSIKKLRDDDEDDGGMVLMKEYFRNLSEKEIIDTVMDYAELGTDYHVIRGEKIA